MPLTALDVAILLPPEVAALAVRLSAALPARTSKGLRLGPAYLPHITLTQHFVDAGDVDAVLGRVAETLSEQSPFTLHVTGGDRGSSSVWMAIDRTPALDALHARLMDVLLPFERRGGTRAAFHGQDARPGDVIWVAGFRERAAYDRFTPHVTLGHAPTPPRIPPFDFTATTVAACQLGRFCSCRRIIRQWTLGVTASDASAPT